MTYNSREAILREVHAPIDDPPQIIAGLRKLLNQLARRGLRLKRQRAGHIEILISSSDSTVEVKAFGRMAKEQFDGLRAPVTRLKASEHLELMFTVVNLVDRNPPIVGSTAGRISEHSGDTCASTYDPLGHRFAASARIKF